ncbi:hypothetical protein [Mycoplasmopsis edwardii]|nr:hypothetical protein [Mycoplasmopsis edwardii]
MKFLKCFLSKTSHKFQGHRSEELIFFIDEKVVELYSDSEFNNYLHTMYTYFKYLNDKYIRFKVVLPNTFSFTINSTDEHFNKIEKRRSSLKKFTTKVKEFELASIFQLVDFKNVKSISFDINKKIQLSEQGHTTSTTFNFELNNFIYTQNIEINENENEKESELYKDLKTLHWFFSTKYNVNGFVFYNIDSYIKTINRHDLNSKVNFIDNVFKILKQETRIELYSYFDSYKQTIKLPKFEAITSRIIKVHFNNTFINNVLDTMKQDGYIKYYDFADYFILRSDEHIFKLEQIKTLINEIILNNDLFAFNFLTILKCEQNVDSLYEFDYLKMLNEELISVLNKKRNTLKLPFAKSIIIKYKFYKYFKNILVKTIKLDSFEYVEQINISNEVILDETKLSPFSYELKERR